MTDVDRAWAFRLPGWAIWNIGPWNPAGWINVGALRTDRGPDGRRRHFQLAWNGERFAYGKGIQRLEYHIPNATAELTTFLRETLPAGATEPKPTSVLVDVSHSS